MRLAFLLVCAAGLAGCTSAPPPPAADEHTSADRVASPQPAIQPEVPHDTPVARGRALAEVNCSTCHAIGRTGDSPYPPAPPFRTLPAKYDVEGLAEAFAEGIEVGHRGPRQMPAFELTPDQIDDLIAYLKSLA